MSKKDIIIASCVGIVVLIVIVNFSVYFYNINLNENAYKEDNSNSNINQDSNNYSSDELERKQDEEMRRKEQEEKMIEEEELKSKIDKQKDEIKKKDKPKIEAARSLYEEAKSFYSNYKSENDQRRKALDHMNDNLIEKIIKKGFTETKEDCNSTQICYTNGTYTVKHVNNANHYYKFIKSLDSSKHKSYNSKIDFDFFSDLYGITFSSELVDTINELLYNSEANSNFSSYNIASNDINVYFSYDKEEISYTITSSTYYSFNKIDYFDTMVSRNDFPKENSLRKSYYDMIINKNKDKYYYADIIDLYFSRNSESICKIIIDGKNYYSLESSVCHGGTSDTYYKFKYDVSDIRIYDTISINIENDYFKANYMDIISNDLNYFSNKLNTSISLNDDNNTKLNNFINQDESITIIEVNDNFRIEIEKENSNYKLKYYIG